MYHTASAILCGAAQTYDRLGFDLVIWGIEQEKSYFVLYIVCLVALRDLVMNTRGLNIE